MTYVRMFVCCAVSLVLFGCAPPLTEKRVIEDLGEDDLVLTIFTVDDQYLEAALHACRPGVTSLDEERAAAEAAGWTEEVCKGDPTMMKLTAQGREASMRWRSGGPSLSASEEHRWDATVARYERTGAPVIRLGANLMERRVTIPGRWIPNDDGKKLYETGWKTITTVNREERYTYSEGVWARHHLGR